eukprot:908495-Pleurochrysis_carterae.AAC.2
MTPAPEQPRTTSVTSGISADTTTLFPSALFSNRDVSVGVENSAAAASAASGRADPSLPTVSQRSRTSCSSGLVGQRSAACNGNDGGSAVLCAVR